MSNNINEVNDQGAELDKESSDLETLINHRVLIDLHGTKLHEAMSMAGSWAHRVINSKDMMCIGLIHGRGVHSGEIHAFDEFDEFDETRELRPVLKPKIRALMDKLAYNTGCYSIYGEKLFCVERQISLNKKDDDLPSTESFTAANNGNDGLHPTLKIVGKIDMSFLSTLETRRRRRFEKIGITVSDNYDNTGITYFMNKAYYEYFKAAQIEWTEGKIKGFQSI